MKEIKPRKETTFDENDYESTQRRHKKFNNSLHTHLKLILMTALSLAGNSLVLQKQEVTQSHQFLRALYIAFSIGFLQTFPSPDRLENNTKFSN